jgi:hypothetical protein
MEKSLDDALERSEKERQRFNLSFEKQVQNFWNKHKSKDRMWNVALVEAVACVAFHRCLEDCGVLPTLHPNYLPHSLLRPVSTSQLIAALKVLREQRFLTRENAQEATSILGDETLARIAKVILKEALFEEFKNLFWDSQGAVDLSDLRVSFFGDAYQLFANKTDINGVEGQYFTGSDLAKEAAVYFVEDENKGLAKGEIIFDPFVGSGQLLRALVPFFHILIQGESRNPSIIEGMRTLVERMAGTDIDENACWLARLSLSLATSAKSKPLSPSCIAVPTSQARVVRHTIEEDSFFDPSTAMVELRQLSRSFPARTRR